MIHEDYLVGIRAVWQTRRQGIEVSAPSKEPADSALYAELPAYATSWYSAYCWTPAMADDRLRVSPSPRYITEQHASTQPTARSFGLWTF